MQMRKFLFMTKLEKAFSFPPISPPSCNWFISSVRSKIFRYRKVKVCHNYWTAVYRIPRLRYTEPRESTLPLSGATPSLHNERLTRVIKTLCRVTTDFPYGFRRAFEEHSNGNYRLLQEKREPPSPSFGCTKCLKGATDMSCYCTTDLTRNHDEANI